jgi:hypothetical protein
MISSLPATQASLPREYEAKSALLRPDMRIFLPADYVVAGAGCLRALVAITSMLDRVGIPASCPFARPVRPA